MRRKNKGVNITFSLYPARRRPMLAPSRRRSLDPPSGHANRAPRIPPGAGPCWRHPAGNPLSHRRATPTGRPESRPAPAHVGAVPPATPYPTVGPRQQGAPNPARRPPMLALPRRQSLNPPPGHANRPCTSPEGSPLPEGPQLPEGSPLPEGPCRRLSHSVQIEIYREPGHKKRKMSPFWQLQPKTKIVSIKKTRTIRWKY